MTHSYKDRKIVKLTEGSRVHLPLRFLQEIEFGDMAECILQPDGILIRPIKDISSAYVTQCILEDLILQGYHGRALQEAFREKTKRLYTGSLSEEEAMLFEEDKDLEGQIGFEDLEDWKGSK